MSSSACRRCSYIKADDLLQRHSVRPGFLVICPFAGGLFEKQEKTWPDFAAFTRRLLTLGRNVVACPAHFAAAVRTRRC
jgi:heptosyltransferase-2